MLKKQYFSVPLFLTIFLLGLSGCAGTTPIPETPTEEPVEEETPVNEAAAQEAEVAQEPNYCLDCHADKDQLIATAKAEEVVETESEGAG